MDISGAADAFTDERGAALALNNDQCPATPAGAVVDGTGCSIAPYCPCAGPRGQNIPWHSHEQYVACVTKTAAKFLALRLIDMRAFLKIVSQAGMSKCGYPQCTDGDGGKVPAVFGTVTGGRLQISDRCVGSRLLSEQYCAGGHPASHIAPCSRGCLAGDA